MLISANLSASPAVVEWHWQLRLAADLPPTPPWPMFAARSSRIQSTLGYWLQFWTFMQLRAYIHSDCPHTLALVTADGCIDLPTCQICCTLLADGDWTRSLSALASALCRVETFYDSMGGLVGYQLKSLQLIISGNNSAAASAVSANTNNTNNTSPASTDASSSSNSLEDEQAHVTYHVPPGLDLAGEEGRQLGVRAAAQGLLAMPYLSEILPVGGAGDRLGLRCEVTGEGLPAAMLPYCGRTMLEGLMRDLQAKEYLYWHLTGTQVGT